MAQTLTFPGLGLEFELARVAFHIGSIPVTWYGILMASAFLVGILYVMWRVKQFGLDSDRVIDVLLVAIVGGIVGARLYFVAFKWEDYKDNLIEIFKTWNGGIAIYGGLIGAVLLGLLMCRIRKVKILPMMDLAAGGVIIGQAIGRWGNFMNIEAFGGITEQPWGMSSPVIYRYLQVHAGQLNDIGMQIDLSQASGWEDILVHPTFFYESVWCLLGFVAIALYTKHRRFDGELLCLYGVWYGAGRFVIEGLRTDSLMLGTLRVSQWVALISLAAAAIAWIVTRVKIHRAQNPDYLKLYVHTEEAELIRQGKFYTKTERKQPATTQAEADSPTPNPAQPAATESALDTEQPVQETIEQTDGDTQPADANATPKDEPLTENEEEQDGKAH